VPRPQGAGILLDYFGGGIMMYPITLSALVALGLTVWSARRLWGAAPRVDARVESGVDGVLFWGGFALLLGLLGTVVGIAMAAQAVEMVGEVHPTLVWGGIRLALLTTIWGVVILAASAASWYVLRVRCRSLVARTA
jgi:biopolymer transport protein ExbB/TolQ